MTYSETLVVTSCWCGIALAIPSNLHRYAKDKKNHAIFCPLGHEFIFGDTNEEKLKAKEEELARERKRVQATRELLHQEERSHVATRGHLTRAKKRAHGGACQYCNRTFVDMARHVASKHPEHAHDH
jgi:hypothetical protein